MAWSLNGCGTKFYGQRDYRADGSYITTEWIVVFYIPLVPLRSLRVRYQGPTERSVPIGFGSAESYAVYEKAAPNWRQVLCTYSLIGLYVGGLTIFLTVGPRYFPNGLEGQNAAFLGLAAAVVITIFVPRILRYRAKRKICTPQQAKKDEVPQKSPTSTKPERVISKSEELLRALPVADPWAEALKRTERYFVGTEVTKKGPYSLSQLKTMWSNGTLTSDTDVWMEREDKWRALQNVVDADSHNTSARIIGYTASGAEAPTNVGSKPRPWVVLFVGLLVPILVVSFFIAYRISSTAMSPVSGPRAGFPDAASAVLLGSSTSSIDFQPDRNAKTAKRNIFDEVAEASKAKKQPPLLDDLIPKKSIRTATDVARAAFPSVVLLGMRDAQGQLSSVGSGFLVKKNIVATNFHVVDGASGGYVKLIGRPAQLSIEGIVGIDGAHDLALIQIASSDAPPLPVSERLQVAVGDSVYAVGNPRGLEGTFSQGIISSIRVMGFDQLLQITAPISPGSSGGPVLDQTGTVVGVSAASFTNGQNLNFAIPSEYVSELLKKRTELRAFTAIPRTNIRNALLDRVGGQPSRNGATAENLTFDFHSQIGLFSVSLRNRLSDSISNISAIAIFYDTAGHPLDIAEVRYAGVIPSALAKRVTGKVDPSVEALNSPLTTGPGGYRVLASAPPRKPVGKVDVRILDFVIQGSE